jgi:hypothetical protein
VREQGLESAHEPAQGKRSPPETPPTLAPDQAAQQGSRAQARISQISLQGPQGYRRDWGQKCQARRSQLSPIPRAARCQKWPPQSESGSDSTHSSGESPGGPWGGHSPEGSPGGVSRLGNPLEDSSGGILWGAPLGQYSWGKSPGPSPRGVLWGSPLEGPPRESSEDVIWGNPLGGPLGKSPGGSGGSSKKRKY